MLSLTMNVETIKQDIINWLKQLDDEQILSKIEELKIESELKNGLTEDQKEAIIRSISILEEE
jgi:hypothetical protein